MSNYKNIKSPLRVFPTHKVIQPVWFVKEKDFLLDEPNILGPNLRSLQDNEQVLVLETIVALIENTKESYSKIKLSSNEIGYVSTQYLEPLEDVPDFAPISLKDEYQPNRNSALIDWKSQPIDEPYEDNYLGSWAVHCEFPDIVSINGEDQLWSLMQEARKKCLKLTFEKVGFELNDDLSNKLLNNYYQFITSEKWYIDPRPCSTLRVFVVLPKAYLYADNPDIKKIQPGKEKEPVPKPPDPDPERYFIRKFKDYDEYKVFFDKLIQILEHYEIYFITRQWVMEPDAFRNFSIEAKNVRGFVEETNLFLQKNHPKFVQEERPDIFSTPSLKWNFSLDIVVDKKEHKIKAIKYYSDKEKLSLSVGLLSYLKNEYVSNQTTANYIVVFDPEKDSYDAFKAAAQNIADTSPLLAGAAILGGGLIGTAAVGAAVGAIGLLGGNPEDEIKKFLTEKHYPVITNVYPKPVDLVNCSVDTIQRISDLTSVRTPQEIAKWKKLRKAYEKKKKQNEGDLFTKSLTAKDVIKDKNMRILFGIDKLPNKTNKQKLAAFIRVARALDWAKFLGLSAQCLSASLPPNIVMALMSKYKEARKFIESIFLSTICNPYLKNGLKVINGFQLPVLRAYNPNQSLIQELENAFIQIINDLISLGIKKALEAAAKACTRDLNQPPNFPTGNNPFEPNANITDPALNDYLNDVYDSIKNNPGPVTEEDKIGAKNTLKNIIEDITTCMTTKEICSLYKGETVNDEAYQVIISLIKRKYGSPYSELFGTRQQIAEFFRNIGNGIDLSICNDNISPEETVSGPNILCDDGKVENLRRQILQDKGLSPELIDQALASIREDEARALEDILKLLDSENPFDFSKVPDIACKIFPNGASLSPSQQEYLNLANTLFKTVYNNFDREARDWYKTTYTEYNSNSVNFFQFNSGSGRIETVPDIKLDPKISEGLLATAKFEDKTGWDGYKNTKYPGLMFRLALDGNNSALQTLLSDSLTDSKTLYENNHIIFSGSLNGTTQQKFDINFIEKELRDKISNAEKLLGNLLQAVWSQVLKKMVIEIVDFTADTLEPDSVSAKDVLNSLGPILNLLNLADLYLRNNVTDTEELKIKLKNAYKVLGVSNINEANAFFAAEEGAAVYLVICEEMFYNTATITSLNQLMNFSTEINESNSILWNSNYNEFATLRDLYDKAKIAYDDVKGFYNVILKTKVNYPDFNIVYETGLDKITLPNGSEIKSFQDEKLYDIHRLQITKNSKTFIKNTEINKVSDDILSYIKNPSGLNVQDLGNLNKHKLLHKFITDKINKFGLTSQDGREIISYELFSEQIYEDINKRLYDSIKNNILSEKNKFMFIREYLSPDYITNTVRGTGQPYTQYLKLVVPQTAEQKACNVRPHYLEVDSIKKQILDEKSKNVCIEKIIDDRTVGKIPINVSELEDIETTETQKIFLNGGLHLAARIFLHDIVLRGIHVFGVYDPQSLRDDKMFISFMARMVESEMRGMDNIFFNILTSFLLKQYKASNPEENITNEILKKTELFRDFVEGEIKNYVLPKLAKRIHKDTNEYLAKENLTLINIKNVFEDSSNYGIIVADANAVYLNFKCTYKYFDQEKNEFITKTDYIRQKIYERANINNNLQIMLEFISTVEYDFLFKYIFPTTQTLNYIFMLDVLCTSTRRQVSNAFKDTKRDIISTCKIIQSNGQIIASNPNDAQSTENMNPLKLIASFLIKALLTTPIKILKGIVESSEPNVALISTVYKTAKSLKPDLTSAIIPAVSIPLGTLPTPVTSPMPFINPLLTTTYFATLAWYEDGPGLADMADEWVNNLGKEEINCDDIYNQDNFYESKQPISFGEYDKDLDIIKTPPFYSTMVQDDVFATDYEQALGIAKKELFDKAVNQAYNLLFNETLTVEYIENEETKTIDYVLKDKLEESKLKNFIIEAFNTKKVDTVYDKDYNVGIELARENIRNYLSNVFRKLESMPITLDRQNALVLRLAEVLEFPLIEDPNDVREAVDTYFSSIWYFMNKPHSYEAMKQAINSAYEDYSKNQLQINQQVLLFRDWVEIQLNGFKGSPFYPQQL